MKFHSLTQLATGLVAAATVAAAGTDPRHAPGAYIFEFEPQADVEPFFTALAGVGEVRLRLESAVFKGASVQLDENDTAEARRASALLADLPIVKNVWPLGLVSREDLPHPDMIISAEDVATSTTTNDKHSERRQNINFPLAMTQVDRLHKRGIKGDGITIAVVDSGVDYTHPALGGCLGEGCVVAKGWDFIGNGTVAKPQPNGDPMDFTGHGTHVAGIIAMQADSNPFGLSGVAPEITIHAYKVQGPVQDVTEDTLIAAFHRAVDEGADIITSSIGANGGWSDGAWAVVASRIVAQGIPCTLSQGNEGNVGPFTGDTAADGFNVTAVAAYDNTHNTFPLLASSFSVDGGHSQRFGYYLPPLNTITADKPLHLPLWTPAKSAAGDACAALPSDTPDLSSRAVLLRRGGCSYDQKIANIVAKGARTALFYMDGPTLDFTVFGPKLQFAVMLTKPVGDKFIDLLAGGHNVTLNLTLPAEAEMFIDTSLNDQTGGGVTTLSSWGPTYEMTSKPQFGAPGGNILSLWLNHSYVAISGTSMSTPHTAGVIALIRQIRGEMPPGAVDRLLSSTAKAQLYNDGNKFYNFLAPVAQQGAGLIQAFDAAYATTLLEPMHLAFNDTDHMPSQLEFVITNTGESSISYKLKTVNTPTVYGLKSDGNSPNLFPPEMTDVSASLKLNTTSFTVEPGCSVTVAASATPPAGLPAHRLPIWSGYVTINGTDGSSLALPYQGLAASLHNLAVLYDTRLSFNNANVAAGANVTLPPLNYNEDQDPNKKQKTLLFQTRTRHGSRQLRYQVVSADNSTQVIGTPYGCPTRKVTHRAITRCYWSGRLESGERAPVGKYKFAISALKTFGSPDEPKDWDRVESDPFAISYQASASK